MQDTTQRLELPFETYGHDEGVEEYSEDGEPLYDFYAERPGECFACGAELGKEDEGWDVCVDCLYDGCADADNITLHPVKKEETEKVWRTEYPFAEEKIDVVRAVWRDLQAWAGLKHPEEIGGLMFSGVDDRFVTGATLLRNAQPEGSRRGLYSPDPQEFFRQLTDLENRGYKVVGWWHSHPNIPAVPSWTDLQNHKHPFKMFIFSVSEQKLRAYHWKDTEMLQELQEYKIEVV